MNIVTKLFGMKVPGFSTTSRVCRTRMVSGLLFECRVKKPDPRYCEFSLSMGDGFICRHHDRTGFVGK